MKDAVFSHRNRPAGGLPGRLPGEGANCRAGSFVRDDDPRIRWSEGEHDQRCRSFQISASEVFSDDRLELVLDDHDPDVPASGCDLQSRRQLRRRDPDRHGHGQACLPPARQSLLHFDGEDEEDPAADRGPEGPLSRRQGQAAARADGAVQARGCQSGRRLPADGDPNSGVLRSLQGHLHHHRDAARAVLRLDPGSERTRPDQRVHPVRPGSLGSDRGCRRSAISSTLASGRSSWACRCSFR